MTKNKKKLRRAERRYSVTKSAQTLVLAGMLLAGGVSGAMAGDVTELNGETTWTVDGSDTGKLSGGSDTTVANSNLTFTITDSATASAIEGNSSSSNKFTSTGSLSIINNTNTSGGTFTLGGDNSNSKKLLATIKTIDVQGAEGKIATLKVLDANSGLLIAGGGNADADKFALGDGGTLNLKGYTALKLDTADADIKFGVKGTDGALVNVTGLSNTIGKITTITDGYGVINVGTTAADVETSGVLIVTGAGSVIGAGADNNGGVTMNITEGSAAYFKDTTGTALSLGVGGTIIADTATIGVGNAVTDFAANKGLLVGKSLTLAGGELVVANGLTVNNATAANAELVQNTAASSIYGDVALQKGTLTLTGDTLTVYTADSYNAVDKTLGMLSITDKTDVAGGSGALVVGTLKLNNRDTLVASGTGLDITANTLDLSGDTIFGATNKGVHSMTITGTAADTPFLTGGDLELAGAASNEATLTLTGVGGTTEKNITLSGNGADGDTKLIVEAGDYTVKNIAVGSTTTAKFGDIQVGNSDNGGNLTATKIELYGTATGNATLTVGESSQTAQSTLTVDTLIMGDGTKVGDVEVTGNSGADQGSTLTITTALTVGAGSLLDVKANGVVDASALDNLGSQAGKIDVSNGTLKTGNLSIDNANLTSTGTAANAKIEVAATGKLDVNGLLTLKGTDATTAVDTAVAGDVLVNTLKAVGTGGAAVDLTWDSGDLTIRGGDDAGNTSIFNGTKLTVAGNKELNLTANSNNGGGTYTGTLEASGGALNVTQGKWSVTTVDVKDTSNSALTVNGGTLTVTTLKTAGTTGTVTVAGTGILETTLANFGDIKTDKTLDRTGTPTVNSGTKVAGDGTLALTGQGTYKGGLTLTEAGVIRTGLMGGSGVLDLKDYTINAGTSNTLKEASGFKLASSTLGLSGTDADNKLTANAVVKDLAVQDGVTGAVAVDMDNKNLNIIGVSAGQNLIANAKAGQVTFTTGTGTLMLGDANASTRGGGILNAKVDGAGGTLAFYNGDFTLAEAITGAPDIVAKGTNLTSDLALSVKNVNIENGSLSTIKDKDLTITGPITLKGDGSGIASGNNLDATTVDFTSQEDGGKSVLSAVKKLTIKDIDSKTNAATSSVAIEATTLAAGNVELGKGSTLLTKGTGPDKSTMNLLDMQGATGEVGDLTVATTTNLSDGASLTVKGKLVATGGDLLVGGEEDKHATTLKVNELDLKNNDLFVDPAWIANEYNPSQVAVKKFTGDKINGNVGVGRNSQVTLGSDSPEWLSAQVQKLGGWNKDGITAALGIYTPQTLGAGQGIAVNGLDTVKPTFTPNTVDFKANSLLVVNAAGLNGEAALTAETAGTVTIADTAKLRVSGVQSGKTVTVLDNFSTININADKGWSEKAGNLTTDSHMLYGVLNVDNDNDAIKVGIRAHEAQSIFPKLSSGMAGLVNGFYAQGLYDVESRNAGIKFMSRATNTDMMPNTEQAAATIEGAAQLAVVGAAPAMTLSAVQAGTSTVTTRTSFASPLMDSSKAVALHKDVDGTLSVDSGLNAGSGMKNGFGLWIMPLYQSNSAWGMKADGFKGGYKSDLGGVALGADYTFNDMFRLGLAFNIGGGYAESNGDFNKTENSFNFWGINAYGGWTMNNFGITADVGYTGNYNKLQQELPGAMGMSDIKSDVNSSAWTAGLRGEYKFATEALDIIPHVGVRYTGLTTDEYKAKSGGDTVFKVDQSFQSIWTFPIGVTLAKEIETGSGWIIRPQVDLGITPATGDVKAKSKTRIPGVDAQAEMKMQVVDYMSYDGGLGLEMKKDNVSFGINYNIQASEHRTGHGVFGTFRYEF